MMEMEMKKRSLTCVLVLTLFSLQTFAQEPDKTRKPGPQSIERISGTPRYQLLNINNITTWIRSDGQSNHSPVGAEGTLYPRGTAWVIYQDGMLWVGKAYLDSAFTIPAPERLIRAGGQTYHIGTQQGWVQGFGANAVSAPLDDPRNRAYRIRRDYAIMTSEELARDAAEWFEIPLSMVSASQIDMIRAQYHTDWTEWPVDLGAPYIERNGVPGYQPPPPFEPSFTPTDLLLANYDEPGISGNNPYSPADQVVWIVCNDLNSFLSVTWVASPRS
jgi:hypothetical protein